MFHIDFHYILTSAQPSATTVVLYYLDSTSKVYSVKVRGYEYAFLRIVLMISDSRIGK
jgi:hypothetical protein